MEDISNEVGRGVVLTSIGEVHRFREQYDKALSYYQQALEIMRVEEDIPKEAIALNNIAFAYKSLEEYDKAIEHYKQAIILMKTVNDPYGAGAALSNICAVYLELGFYQEALNNCQKALGFASEIGDNIGKGVALNNIASVYKAQGEPEEALRYYEQAITTLESVRAVSGSDIGRAGFISYFISVYNNAIQLYYQQNQSELAFLTSERGRARSFLDSLGTGEVLLDDANIHEEQLEELQKITILELLEVQNLLLDERTTLLSYWILGEEGALAFVITHDDLTVVELPEATTENLQKALVIESTGETTIELSDWLRQNVHNPHPLQLRNLHAWLVAPLAEHLNTPLVGIIPHQLLHYVPFAALTDGESYFGQQYTLFTLPSASALRFIKENAGDLQESNQPPFVVGNPDTNGRLPPLPYAAAEATAVASLLNAPIYTTAEASETQLRDSISGAPVVHLAAHGEYNVFNQYYSAIHLAQPSSSQEEVLTENEDGRLEVHEIYGLDLRSAELVVLSACQTNIGEITQANRVISAGDEIVGLTRAFFFAGTPTVISSLWSVDDAATEKLMVAFYYNWLEEGLSKAEALQAAQAHLRTLDGGRYASPFYWAGFVLNGDGGVYTGVVPTVPSTAAASTPTSETVAELAQETAEQPVKLEDGQEDSESSRGIYYSAVILVILLVIILTGFRRGKRHGSLL
jgi:CHAT domain-containing protein